MKLTTDMPVADIEAWLRCNDAEQIETLTRTADIIRRANVGDAVHLRGLVEIGNYCVRACEYCGLRFDNKGLSRYRMSEQEIMDCAQQAVQFGDGTLVMQSGEDYGFKTEFIARIVSRVKAESPLAVTLSIG